MEKGHEINPQMSYIIISTVLLYHLLMYYMLYTRSRGSVRNLLGFQVLLPVHEFATMNVAFLNGACSKVLLSFAVL